MRAAPLTIDFSTPFAHPVLGEGQGAMAPQGANQKGDQKMTQQTSEIQIYIACLAAYNNGILHGAWIDATQDEADIWDGISAVLKSSPIEDAEEWAIHDYDGFEGMYISEYEDIGHVCKLAGFIEAYGKLGAELYTHFGNHLESAQKAIEDCYAGEYSSLANFAQDITEETSQIPENLAYYIDWEAMARDMDINDVFTIETGFEEIHVFWNH